MNKKSINEIYSCPDVKVRIIESRRPLCESGLEHYKVNQLDEDDFENEADANSDY